MIRHSQSRKREDNVGFTITYSDGETQIIYLEIALARVFHEWTKDGHSVPLRYNKERTFTATIHLFDLPKLSSFWFKSAHSLLKPEEYMKTLN